jgi:hypothetical protein
MENQMTVNTNLKTNPMAIASLVLSAGGFSFLPLVGSIAGIITGNIARNEIREKPDLYNGESLAKVGIGLGWVGIILPFVLLALGLLFFIPFSVIVR